MVAGLLIILHRNGVKRHGTQSVNGRVVGGNFCLVKV